MKYLIYKWAKKYIKFYENFSYSFKKNGEKYLLDSLAKQSVRTVFDVGANIGDWTTLAGKKINGAKFHLFELSESTFKTLSSSFDGCENVVTNNLALSNSKGKIQYQDYGKDSGLNSILEDTSYHKMRSVLKDSTSTTGDEYCRENGISHIDFLKIDVEGAEHIVLEGFAEMLGQQAIDLIQFEYGYTHGDAHFLIKDFYNFFHKFGYKIGPLKKKGVIFMDFNYKLNEFNSGPNFVAVSEKKTDLIKILSGPSIKGFAI